MTRSQLLVALAELIVTVGRPHPVRVAIDGIDASGKTTLADELAMTLGRQPRQVLRATIDGFHQPRAIRYRRGPDSPEGYFHDSFDYATLRAALLDPLGPGGNLRYRTAAFDFRRDAAIPAATLLARPDAILLFDGVFLLRPELTDAWDWTIFVDVDFPVTLERAMRRDRSGAGPGEPPSAEQVRRRYRRRYIPGQRLYLVSYRPLERSDVVIDNNDPEAPGLRLRGHG